MSEIVWKDDSDIVIASTLGQVKQIALALRGDILRKFAEIQAMADLVSTERNYPITLCIDLMQNNDFQKCLDMLDPDFPGLEPTKIFDYWGLAMISLNILREKVMDTADWKNYHRQQNEIIEIARSNLKRIGL